MKFINVCIITIISLLILSCSTDDSEIENILENTTWTYKSYDGYIATLKIHKNSKVQWDYRHESGPIKFTEGIYKGEYPSIIIHVYGTSLVTYEAYFQNSMLYLYDSNTQGLLFKLEKVIV